MRYKNTVLITVLMLVVVLISLNVYSQPSGADIIFNESETKQPAAAEYLNTSGGSFTTLILSSETQNLKWKAYAGNVTGVLTLDDSGDYSIYQWSITNMTGEVYASRTEVEWENISCANSTHIYQEEEEMNHSTTADDSINNTFSNKLHKEFFVGTKKILQSSCPSTFTWVNDAAQVPSIDAPFQEVLLNDGVNLVYTTFIDDDTQGFNYKSYDFQMIVAENGIASNPNTRYYFYLELQ